MELNATQAARLYGKSRMTIWRYVTSGKLSSRSGDDGQRLIDLSELIRVFGEPNRPVTPVTVTPQTSDTPSDTALSDLVAEVRLLREEQQASREENRLLREEVRELRETLLRIEHKPRLATTSAPAPKVAPAKKAESFADLLEGLDDN